MADNYEHAEQVTFVAEVRRRWPSVLIHSIPNGGKRSISVARKMKAEGLVSGVPDLFVPALTLWIEMKRVRRGSVSKEQTVMIQHLRAIGHTVIVAKGWQNGIEQVAPLLDRHVAGDDLIPFGDAYASLGG
jgi:hypothetical protein